MFKVIWHKSKNLKGEEVMKSSGSVVRDESKISEVVPYEDFYSLLYRGSWMFLHNGNVSFFDNELAAVNAQKAFRAAYGFDKETGVKIINS